MMYVAEFIGGLFNGRLESQHEPVEGKPWEFLGLWDHKGKRPVWYQAGTPNVNHGTTITIPYTVVERPIDGETQKVLDTPANGGTGNE